MIKLEKQSVQENTAVFAANLHRFRLERNLTVRSLAAITGIRRRMLKNAERGRLTERFTVEHLLDLCAVLHAAPDQMLTRSDSPR